MLCALVVWERRLQPRRSYFALLPLRDNSPPTHAARHHLLNTRDCHKPQLREDRETAADKRTTFSNASSYDVLRWPEPTAYPHHTSPWEKHRTLRSTTQNICR
ncbi:hypothetical protein F2P81_022585 [Scophthalmus maximus]|uniref:Uncharacterized protein n=1 Tax=Scophthalmus maximus TaxID=52904 RepID=A0A6A4S593_SCOMX|nr:hypothetical protein F2P81_022585 [Scophthalmus maximus]